MFGQVCFLVFSPFLFQLSFVSGDCVLKEDCQFHDWMSWQPCTGHCGNQKQLRQREFCCPENTNPKTKERCLSACSLSADGNAFDEYKPCWLCYNGLLLPNNICRCNDGYTGSCCQGLSVYYSTLHETYLLYMYFFFYNTMLKCIIKYNAWFRKSFNKCCFMFPPPFFYLTSHCWPTLLPGIMI